MNFRKKYHPVTVVNMASQEYCCRKIYNLTLQCDDKSYFKINVTGDDYVQATLGGTMHFERHLTVPAVAHNTNRLLPFYFVGSILMLIGLIKVIYLFGIIGHGKTP